MDLSKIIEDYYRIPVENITRLEFGFSNINYEISSYGKSYICRISPQNKIGHIKMELDILSKLNSNIDFSIPYSIKAKNNRDFVNINGSIITLFKKIEGENASLYKNRLEKFQEDFAKKTAKLHIALSKIELFQRKYDHVHAVNSYNKIFKSYFYSKNQDAWQKLITSIYPNLIQESEKYIFYLNNSKNEFEMIHTDLRLENLILKDNKIVGIVDFDDVLFGLQSYDLSKIMIDVFGKKHNNHSSIENIIDIDNFESFFSTYLEINCTKSINFIQQVVELSNLIAIQVLSIAGRNPDFNPKKRVESIKTYSNILSTLSRKENLDKLIYRLKMIQHK